MPHPEPSLINQLQPYRPSCSKCGSQTMLIGIEPAPEPGHDLCTFACAACGNYETIKAAHRAA